MPIDTSPEGAELLHQPVVKPFPEISPKDPRHAHHGQQAIDDDGHNHDEHDEVDAGATSGTSAGAGLKPGPAPAPPA